MTFDHLLGLGRMSPIRRSSPTSFCKHRMPFESGVVFDVAVSMSGLTRRFRLHGCVRARLLIFAFARQVPGNSDDEEAVDSAAHCKWTSLSRSTRIRCGMPLDCTMWADSHSLSGLDRGKQQRLIEVVEVAHWFYLLDTPRAADRSDDPEWFTDASQGVDRKPWSRNLPCLAQDSVPYSFKLDRVLQSEDHQCKKGFVFSLSRIAEHSVNDSVCPGDRFEIALGPMASCYDPWR
jgi:hypothetical protein